MQEAVSSASLIALQCLSQISSLQPQLFFPSSVALCDSSPGFISVWQPLQPTFLLSPVYSGRAHCKFLTEPFPKIQIYLLFLTVVRSAVPKSHRDGALGAERSDKLACSACQVQLAENSLDLFINCSIVRPCFHCPDVLMCWGHWTQELPQHFWDALCLGHVYLYRFLPLHELRGK